MTFSTPSAGRTRLGSAARLLAAFGIALSPAAARAEGTCPALTTLLAHPPSGFVALRGEKTSETWAKWDAKPFLPGFTCSLEGDVDDPRQELRCTLDGHADPSAATAWYKSMIAEIDGCLSRRPHAGFYVRRAEVASHADGASGVTTTWLRDDAGGKSEITLSDGRVSGHVRDTLSVTYMRR